MSNDEHNNEPAVEQAEAEQIIEPSAEDFVTEGDELSALKAELEAKEAELANVKDQAMRTAAEAQNIKRRAEKDVENAHKFGIEKFAKDLLAVGDNLQRALESLNAEDDATKAAHEGVSLTHKTLVDTFAKHKLVEINPEGEPFDPNLHQAMSMVDAPDAEPNTVVAVMAKGYTLNERLLRPAMVMVSKA